MSPGGITDAAAGSAGILAVAKGTVLAAIADSAAPGIITDTDPCILAGIVLVNNGITHICRVWADA